MQIALIGDVMLGRLVNHHLATARRTRGETPWSSSGRPTSGRQPRMRPGSAVSRSPGKVFHFRSDLKNVASLLAAGIDAVSLANNHVLDYGADAFREMLPALDAAGILHAGAGTDKDAARRPAVRRVGAAAVGFLAFTDNEPGWEAGATFARDPLCSRGGRGEGWPISWTLSGGPRQASSCSSFQHTGAATGAPTPRPEHQDLAHALIDAGADVVFGHSPHIFRGVGIHRNRPIIYSAGDFVDDYAVDPVERNDQSFIFMLETEEASPACCGCTRPSSPVSRPDWPGVGGRYRRPDAAAEPASGHSNHLERAAAALKSRWTRTDTAPARPADDGNSRRRQQSTAVTGRRLPAVRPAFRRVGRPPGRRRPPG